MPKQLPPSAYWAAIKPMEVLALWEQIYERTLDMSPYLVLTFQSCPRHLVATLCNKGHALDTGQWNLQRTVYHILTIGQWNRHVHGSAASALKALRGSSYSLAFTDDEQVKQLMLEWAQSRLSHDRHYRLRVQGGSPGPTITLSSVEPQDKLLHEFCTAFGGSWTDLTH